jgi:hypothetical protein
MSWRISIAMKHVSGVICSQNASGYGISLFPLQGQCECHWWVADALRIAMVTELTIDLGPAASLQLLLSII